MDEAETGVLVIGAGLAGLRAAIAARAAGARVILASKGKVGRSGASAMTTAGYAAVLDSGPADDSPALHADDTARGGMGIADSALLRALCEGAGPGVEWLESIGAVFEAEGGCRRHSISGDHSRARVIVTRNHIGTDLTHPMTAEAERLGVEFAEFRLATALLQDQNGRVAGARFLDLRGGGMLTVRAGGVVLATGGAGRLYPLTSNPNDVTGDAFGLADGIGAELRDMEFIQFYPWRCIDPFDKARVSVQPSTFSLGARLYDAAGERFMLRANPEGAEATTRDVAARSIFRQMQAGLGVRGGVRLDLSAMEEETFAISNPKIARACRQKGIDYRTYPFVVTPEAHYWMGGLAVDIGGATTVPGLWCAGEAAGGIHGANRANSNALPEAMVFGEAAGRAAAVAAQMCAAPKPAAVKDVLPRDNGLSGAELTAELALLRDTAWRDLGIVRDADGLSRGLAGVLDIASRAAERGPGPELRDLRGWHELGFLCRTAIHSLTAALMRRESRGAHFRADFPQPDDAAWRGSIFTRAATPAGRPEARYRPVREMEAPHAAE